MNARTVEVTAELTQNIIEASAEITPKTIEASVELTTGIRHYDADQYEGQTEVTPSSETQTLNTEGLVLKSDIVINPIPSNYGRITWDGQKITVS